MFNLCRGHERRKKAIPPGKKYRRVPKDNAIEQPKIALTQENPQHPRQTWFLILLDL
jgi:hypothetical protein